jgi:phosphate transport system protein
MTSTRSRFDYELKKLEKDLVHLSEMVSQAVDSSVTALFDHDIELAKEIERDDTRINKLRLEIEESCYTMVALQQPNTADMRMLMASVSIVTNLERMGDHAAGIARLVERLGTNPSSTNAPVPTQFREMSRIALNMLHNAMAGLDRQDVPLEQEVIKEDGKVDALHKEVYDLLLQHMIKDPSSIEPCTLMLWVSHNLERIADRVTNICERVVYLLTGELTETPDPMP